MSTKPSAEKDQLAIVADLLAGKRHTRQSVAAATGLSAQQGSRWLAEIAKAIPGMKWSKDGRSSVLSYERPRDVPRRQEIASACVAASLGSLFAGTPHEHNLRNGRDFLLRARGDSPTNLDRKFVFAARGGEDGLLAGTGDLDDVIEALLKDEGIAFAYTHNDGTRDQVAALPLSLVIFDKQLYVIAERPDDRPYPFRFARMSSVERTAPPRDYPSRNEYEPHRLLKSSLGIHVGFGGTPELVEITLRGAWAAYARLHRWHSSQDIVEVDASTVRVRILVRLCPEVETWVLGFGENAVVEGPAQLRATVERRLRAATRQYPPTPPLAKTSPQGEPAASKRRTR